MIKVNNLTKYFWGNKILDNISFEIEEWEICWFVWPNWAWKSTTMKILATLILDFEWEVFIDAENIRENVLEARKKIGFMPDEYWLYENLTLKEYLEFFSLAYFWKSNEKFIFKILEKVELKDKKDEKIGNLSRWMNQRICIAKALISKPKVLILDEPASWFDPKLRYSFKKLLLELKKEKITIFISSHILSELWEYCDRIIFINKWKILKDGNFKEMKNSVKSNTVLLEIYKLDEKKVTRFLKDNKIFFEKVEKNDFNLENTYLEMVK